MARHLKLQTRLLLPLVLFGISLPNTLAQDFDSPGAQPDFGGDEVYEYKELPPLPEARKKKKTKSFSGYTKQKDYFYNLCIHLYEDGRNEVISKVGEQYKGGVVGCPACKTFFRLLFSQCRKVPSKYKELDRKISSEKRRLEMIAERKAKGEDPPEEAPPAESENGEEPEKKLSLEELKAQLPTKQLEPRLTVIDAVLRFSQMLVDDTKRVDDHYKAVKLLEDTLLDPKERTVRERHYIDVFVTYLKAPFLQYEDRRVRLELLEDQKAEQRKREFMLDTNQLFGGIEESLEWEGEE